MSNNVYPLPNQQVYIAHDDLNFDWELEDVHEIEYMWKQGIPIKMIASNFGRNIDEVFLILYDRARKGHIKFRPGGIFGRS